MIPSSRPRHSSMCLWLGFKGTRAQTCIGGNAHAQARLHLFTLNHTFHTCSWEMKSFHQNRTLEICSFLLFKCVPSPHIPLSFWSLHSNVSLSHMSLWLFHPPSNSTVSFYVECFIHLMVLCLYMCFMFPDWLFTFFQNKTSYCQDLTPLWNLPCSTRGEKWKFSSFLP